MNLTTTNYLFPTKEGRFQRWRRLSFCPPCGMGAAARCEGRCPSGAGRETWLLLPEVGGCTPHAPHREGAPPRAPGVFAGLAAPAPTCRRSALHPGDFPDAGKVTKGAPRAAPSGIPRGGRFAPPAASRNPLDRVSASNPDRFATLRWVGESVFFLPGE